VIVKKNVLQEVRQYLSDWFADKALFREQMAAHAEERGRPWDIGKNEAYALSLRHMSNYVARLRSNNPTLRALIACDALWDDDAGFEIPSDPDGVQGIAEAEAIHCGPRGRALEPGDCRKWFARWAADLIAEAPQIRERWEKRLSTIDE
jgi:hypothetical protein